MEFFRVFRLHLLIGLLNALSRDCVRTYKSSVRFEVPIVTNMKTDLLVT